MVQLLGFYQYVYTVFVGFDAIVTQETSKIYSLFDKSIP